MLKTSLQTYQDSSEFLNYMTLCMESGDHIQQSFLIATLHLRSGVFQIHCFEVIKFYELGHSFGHSLRLAQNKDGCLIANEIFENLAIALRFGTKISHTLSQMNAQIRLHHISKLEELAHQAPIKMIFPLVIFIFPVIFMLLGTKTMVNFVQSLGA